MIFDLNKSVLDYPIVAFDTETSGAYAIESQVIELAAVKWQNGKVIDKFQTFLKPKKSLTPDNIRIHGITNEMLVGAPLMSEQIIKFCDFIDDSVLLAHHAPFDLGFMAIDIEDNGLRFPNTFNLCSSLLSRALLHTTNHKLQTLVKELHLEGGAAHRAYDDAYACLQVLFKCTEKIAEDTSLKRLMEIQAKDLDWKNYSILDLSSNQNKSLMKAMRQQTKIGIVYEGGQTSNKVRYITPYGIVRNPDGDYIHAQCEIDMTRKRFYIGKIKEVELI